MIEEIDQRLTEWIRSMLTEDIEVSLLPPKGMGDKKIVGIYLKDILPSAPTRGTRRPPLQVLLRYLVTSWAKSPKDAHHILGQLLFAAMQHPEYEVELEPIPAQVWTAFGTFPMPAFMLRLPLRVERPEKSVRLIRSPIEVTKSPLASMEGMVMGPDQTPLTNARVELSTHNLVARTDVKGRFIFPTVPTKPALKKIRIIARGQELFKEVDYTKVKQEPLIIHFELLEV
jgi:Pvc16 N-terminal domain